MDQPSGVNDNLAPLIQAIDQADSKGAMVVAVGRLAAQRRPEAIPTLIRVLGYNNPGAAVAAVDGLVALGEAAVPALLEELDGYNYGARAWAIRALSLIGDPRALDILLDTATGDFALSVRRAAAKGLGHLHWNLLPPDQVAEAQALSLKALIQGTEDPEWVVRYAAVVGLQALALALCGTARREEVATIHHHLQRVCQQDESLAAQARATLALSTVQASLLQSLSS
ncbi:MAG: HEAT repeat domain-containing protein [Leptolyngbya sp.]|nr:HEAT repeat domain-containing protein [Leptolyngbya sp.]